MKNIGYTWVILSISIQLFHETHMIGISGLS